MAHCIGKNWCSAHDYYWYLLFNTICCSLYLVLILYKTYFPCVIYVIDAVKPFLALAFGSFVLQDKITSLAIIGITFTSLGVLLVNLEKRSESGSEDALTEDEITHSQVINRLHDSVHSTNSTIDNFELTEPHSGLDATNAPVVSEGFDVVAYLYAFGNVVLDVYSATLIVKWHGALSSADVNLVRFGFATVVLVSVLGIKRQQFQVFNFIFYSKQTESPPSPMSAIDWVAVVCGIVFVTVLTPLINTWVLFKLKLAIAITLNSTSPLWSLPVAYFHHEVISVKAILGAVLATGGIVLLILG